MNFTANALLELLSIPKENSDGDLVLGRVFPLYYMNKKSDVV